jgi:hypothetical protein
MTILKQLQRWRQMPQLKARQAWEQMAVWQRLRFLNSDDLEKCLHWLSQAGRVALYYAGPGPLLYLYIGVAAADLPTLTRMAEDYGFLLREKLPSVVIPPPAKMVAVSDLPWEQAFLAHIVRGVLFVSPVGEENKAGSYFPQPEEPTQHPAISLPPPQPGLTLQPSWNGQQPPETLTSVAPDPTRWLLGRSRQGVPLQAAGRLNLYGQNDAISEWLSHMIGHTLAHNHANLAVIDGVGTLAPRLKRRETVARLLGERLLYLNMDSALVAHGFNPLAPAPGEEGEDTLRRWQTWLAGMGVPQSGLDMLPKAQTEGVQTIPELRKWIDSPDQRHQTPAVTRLKQALDKLCATRIVQEWLDWPTNPFVVFPDGALLFACQAGEKWERRHLLHAILLGCLNIPGARIIVHGFPWRDIAMSNQVKSQPHIVVANGPPSSAATTILVSASPTVTQRLARRFFPGNDLMLENLHLLRPGEGVVLSENTATLVAWGQAAKEPGQQHPKKEENP